MDGTIVNDAVVCDVADCIVVFVVLVSLSSAVVCGSVVTDDVVCVEGICDGVVKGITCSLLFVVDTIMSADVVNIVSVEDVID